jgi:FtsH-binding integral membrane protein
MELLFLISGATFAIAGYGVYFKQIQHSTTSKVRPNRWSWFIWSIATLFETITYSVISEDIWKIIVFGISVLACIFITIRIWKKAETKLPDTTEAISVIACILALVIWFVYQSAWWAHVVLLISLPIAFIPTYRDAWDDYRTEYTMAWVWWSLSDLCVLTLIIARLNKSEELPYAIIEFVSHFMVVAIVALRKVHVKSQIL